MPVGEYGDFPQLGHPLGYGLDIIGRDFVVQQRGKTAAGAFAGIDAP
jgi:hypothetical protein